MASPMVIHHLWRSLDPVVGADVFVRERQHFDGKKAAPPFDDGVRVFLVKRGQNPPSLAAAGVGGVRDRCRGC